MALNVNLIVTTGGASTRSVKETTAAIPIIMTQDTDPVRNGFVVSLAQPGGNTTGLSRVAPELSGKQLELLKEIIPKLSRVAILGGSSQDANEQMLQEIEMGATALRINLQHINVLPGAKDFKDAFQEASKGRAEAVLMLVAGPVYNSQRAEIVELAVKNRLPAMYRNRKDVEAGGLVSYGVSVTDLDRRAATVCGQGFERR